MTVLFVVATIVLFLTIDWAVNRRKQATLAVQAAQPAPFQAYPLRVPEGIFFAKSHTWLSLFPSGKVRLGVDDFLGSLLYGARISLLKNAGDRVEKGDPLMSLSQDGGEITVRAPISGEISAVNSRLADNPELSRDNLFSEGWAYAIKPANSGELRNLLLGSETRSWISGELQRLRDFFAGSDSELAPAAAVLQDGGLPAPGCLLRLSPDRLKKFQDEFLQVS